MTAPELVETTYPVDGGQLLVVPGVARSDAPVVLLLHGAGSGTDTPVLRRLAGLLGAAGVTVGRLEMPYRVAGRRAPDRPARLDAVLTAAVAALGRDLSGTRPSVNQAGGPDRLALAGASMGSRVAVRTAHAVGARGVVALGFPLTPPGARPSRQPELDGAGVPVLVVQGERDAFGRPAADPAAHREVIVVAGADHSFKVRVKDGRSGADVVDEAAGHAAAWLLAQLGPPPAVAAGHGNRFGDRFGNRRVG